MLVTADLTLKQSEHDFYDLVAIAEALNDPHPLFSKTVSCLDIPFPDSGKQPEWVHTQYIMFSWEYEIDYQPGMDLQSHADDALVRDIEPRLLEHFGHAYVGELLNEVNHDFELTDGEQALRHAYFRSFARVEDN